MDDPGTWHEMRCSECEATVGMTRGCRTCRGFNVRVRLPRYARTMDDAHFARIIALDPVLQEAARAALREMMDG